MSSAPVSVANATAGQPPDLTDVAVTGSLTFSSFSSNLGLSVPLNQNMFNPTSATITEAGPEFSYMSMNVIGAPGLPITNITYAVDISVAGLVKLNQALISGTFFTTITNTYLVRLTSPAFSQALKGAVNYPNASFTPSVSLEGDILTFSITSASLSVPDQESVEVEASVQLLVSSLVSCAS